MIDKPHIEYPCSWEYKVIGVDEGLTRAAIAEVMGDQEHSLSFSRSSQTGKYCSLLLVVTVESEERRNSIFVALKAHSNVLMVL
jgi:uncharacterized protein